VGQGSCGQDDRGAAGGHERTLVGQVDGGLHGQAVT
jgi:hypothetical protein